MRIVSLVTLVALGFASCGDDKTSKQGPGNGQSTAKSGDAGAAGTGKKAAGDEAAKGKGAGPKGAAKKADTAGGKVIRGARGEKLGPELVAVAKRVADAKQSVVLRFEVPKSGKASSGEADAIERTIAKVRDRVRGLLAMLGTRRGFRCVETELAPDSDSVDRLVIRVGERERALQLIGQLADVAFDFERPDPTAKLVSFDASARIAWALRGLLRTHRVYLAGSAAGEAYARLRKKLASKGIETPPMPSDASIPKDADAVLCLDPEAAIPHEAWAQWIEAGGRLLLTTSNESSGASYRACNALTRRFGIALSEEALWCGVRDPMSKLLTFGTAVSKTLVFEQSFAVEHPATKALRAPQVLCELVRCRALSDAPKNAAGGDVAAGCKVTELMRSEPYGWLGSREQRPKENELRAFRVAASARLEGGGELIVLGGRAFRDKSFHIGNANLELGELLVEWLAYR